MRRALGMLLWVLLLAAGLTTLAIGPRALWRLSVHRGAQVEINFRLVLPLAVALLAGSGLALLHAERVTGWFASKRAGRAAPSHSALPGPVPPRRGGAPASRRPGGWHVPRPGSRRSTQQARR